MRTPQSLLLLLVSLGAGCATERAAYDERWFWGRHSSMETDFPVTELKARADDEAADRLHRSQNVFALFANFIKPGSTDREVFGILRGSRWVESAAVYLDSGNGRQTFYRAPGETVFRVHLFPQDGRSDWVILCTVTARLTEAECAQFLRGTLPASHARLREFMLVFPSCKAERFTKGKVGLQCP